MSKKIPSLIHKTFSLQKDHTDCGVVCLQSLIRYYGGDSSLEILREKSGTTKTGTTLLGLYQCAHEIGFEANGCEADIDALIEHGEPVILHITIEDKYEHFVICYYFSSINSQFLIGDPAKGFEFWTKEKLENVWQSKTCLTLKPNDRFVKVKQTKSKKRKWILDLIKEDQESIYTIIVLGVFLSLLGMSMSIFSQKLIDDILPQKKLKVLVLGVAFLGFLLIMRVVIQALRDFYIIKQTRDFNKRINKSFFASLLNLPKTFFDTRKIGDFVARLNDTHRIQNVIKHIITTTMIDTMSILISIGFLFYYSWRLSIICLVASPIIFYLIFRFNKRIIKSQTEVMLTYGQNEANYIDSIRGIDIIKGFSKQDLFLKKNEIIYGNFQSKLFDLGKLNLKISFISGITLAVFLLIILTHTSYNILDNKLKLGELMAIIGISNSLLNSITNLALVSIPIQEAKVAFNRMFEYSSIEGEPKKGIDVNYIENITLKHINFRFKGRSLLLENVSLKLEKGKILCLVGESGSGKTTLAEILQKNYFIESGQILVNDSILLESISLSSWRYHTAVVPQNIQLFNGSVLENIILEEQIHQEYLQKLIIDYGFDKFLNSLPQNIMTIIGEEGINLSGGQKQIIGWMRALYHKPQFLILDEPTSSLDKENRDFIYGLISKLKLENKLIIIISHHLEELEKISDETFILDGGYVSKIS